MADIFLSYAREDLEPAGRLAVALERYGWSVFWDRTIPAGKTWREFIGSALADAQCVLVLWSEHSTKSHWVLEEADSGLEREILVPALIDSIRPPLGHGSIQAADLSQWDGSQSDPALQRLIADLKARLDGTKEDRVGRLNIYISFSRESKTVAERLAKLVGTLGHSGWMDEELAGIEAGSDRISAAIRDCDLLVFLVDSVSVKSDHSAWEYGYAAELGKPILPVLVADEVATDTLPPALSKLQHVDYRVQDEASARAFVKALKDAPVSLAKERNATEPPFEKRSRELDVQASLAEIRRSLLMGPSLDELRRLKFEVEGILRRNTDNYEAASLAEQIEVAMRPPVLVAADGAESRPPSPPLASWGSTSPMLGALAGAVIGAVLGLIGYWFLGVGLVWTALGMSGGAIVGFLLAR